MLPTDFLQEFFRFDGRLNRKPYIKRFIIIWILGGVLPSLWAVMNPEFAKAALQFDPETIQTYADFHSETVLLQGFNNFMMLLLLPSIVRRLKDMGLNPYFAVFAFATAIQFQIGVRFDLPLNAGWEGLLAFVNIAFNVFLLTNRGKAGPNKYGADPLEAPSSDS